MKRIVGFLLAVILAFAIMVMPVSAYSTTRVKLDEIGVTLEVPLDAFYITRETSPDDQIWEDFIIGYDEAMEDMDELYIHFSLYANDYSYFFYIMFSDDITALYSKNLNEQSDSELNESLESMVEALVAAKFSILDSYTFTQTQTSFLVVTMQVEDVIHYVARTQVDGNFYTFWFSSFDSPERDKEILTDILNSVSFEALEPKYSKIPVTYTMDDVGVTMTVPAGWMEETPADASSVQARYVNEDGDAILFSHSDLFLMINDMENPREAVALLCRDGGNTPVTDIGYETFQNIDYFKVTRLVGGSPMISNILISGGVWYEFSFLGDENDLDYNDYLELMSSVTYDNISSYRIADNRMDLPADISLTKPSPVRDQQMPGLMVVLLSVVLTLAICCVPVLLMRFAILKAPVPKQPAVQGTFLWGITTLIMSGIFALLTGNIGPAVTSILCCAINYPILRSGKNKTAGTPSPAGGNPPDMPTHEQNDGDEPDWDGETMSTMTIWATADIGKPQIHKRDHLKRIR